MELQDIEERLQKKVALNGRALSETLTPDDMAVVSFWTAVETTIQAQENQRLKDHQDQKPLTPEELADLVEQTGQEILDRNDGDPRRALSEVSP